MIEAAISHTQQHHHLFGVGSKDVTIRLETAASNVDSIKLIHGDPYDWADSSWQTQNTDMTLAGTDGTRDYWTVTIHLPHSRLRYGFQLHSKNETLIFTERGLFAEAPVGVASYFCLPYLHEQELFSPPAWAKDTIWYQIFPERFANGEPNINPDKTIPWGSEEPKQNSYFGGDLQGVINNLDYLSELGITGIYFTPIFKAFSNHKYDTIHYMQLDPQFGDEKTLKTLVEESHKRGIKIMLDAVFNHSGYYFPPFQDVLENGVDSKYADWFHPHNFPLDASLEKPNYETFAYVGSMPKLNTANPEVKEHLLEAARYWIEKFDIDGWRLDVANEVDHAFWREFRTTVKSVKKDVYILGEIWHQSSAWLEGDQFDAVMNYPLTDAIQDYVLRDKSAKEVKHMVTRHLFSYPDKVNAVQFNVLGSHDTARVLTESDGNKNLVKLQYVLLFSFPGAPCIYYGDEIGMSGGNDPGCRACMVWDKEEQDLDMHAFMQNLINWRKRYEAFGTYHTLTFYDTETPDLLLYATSTDSETMLFAINRSNQKRTFSIPSELAGSEYTNLENGKRYEKKVAQIEAESFQLLLFSE